MIKYVLIEGKLQYKRYSLYQFQNILYFSYNKYFFLFLYRPFKIKPKKGFFSIIQSKLLNQIKNIFLRELYPLLKKWIRVCRGWVLFLLYPVRE